MGGIVRVNHSYPRHGERYLRVTLLTPFSLNDNADYADSQSLCQSLIVRYWSTMFSPQLKIARKRRAQTRPHNNKLFSNSVYTASWLDMQAEIVCCPHVVFSIFCELKGYPSGSTPTRTISSGLRNRFLGVPCVCINTHTTGIFEVIPVLLVHPGMADYVGKSFYHNGISL